jgi:predicted transcriptional regulator
MGSTLSSKESNERRNKMAKTNEQTQNENLEAIKRLLMLQLSGQGVEGKRIAAVLDVDAAVVSRILSPKKTKKKK